MPTPKPFVQVACICEKVLREQDDVASVVRIVDRYTFDLPSDLPTTISALPLTIFLLLKSGDVVGEHTVGLRLQKPDGTSGKPQQWPLMFKGGSHGTSVQIAFALQKPEYGQYWFDVMWADEVLTRIPLELRPKTATAAAEPTATAPSHSAAPS